MKPLRLLLVILAMPGVGAAQVVDDTFRSANRQNWYVRATGAEGRLAEGRVRSVDSVSVAIGPTRIALLDVTSVERRHNVGGGWKAGLIPGGLIGGWFGYELGKFCESDCGGAQMGAMAIFGSIGALFGGLVGQIVYPARHAWKPVWSDSAQTDTTTIVLLGTGNPFPDPQRQGPATAIVVGKRVFLFDAGPGVMRQLRAAGLPISGVDALFFTHLHSDHTLGYADLMLTSWVMRRARPFPVYGPPGTARMTEHLQAAYAEDIEMRTKGLEREVEGGHDVVVKEIAPGIVYDSGGVRVTAFAVPHGDWPHAFGFRIDTRDRSIVIAGDTRPSPNVIAAARGVDVLIHEVYPHTRVAPEDRPGGHLWPQYLKEFHTSDLELGAIAAEAKPRLLLLTHVVWLGGTEAEVLAGIRAGGFGGAVVAGRDLGRY